jgi:hypothetical protein
MFGDNPIIDAKLFETGLVFLTQNGNFYMVNNISEPNSVLFANTKNIQDNYTPPDYLFIPASYSRSGRTELIFPHPKHGIINVVEGGEYKYMKSNTLVTYNKSCGLDNPNSDDLGKILNIVMSPGYSLLAMFNDAGKINVFNPSLDDDSRFITSTKLSFKPGSYQIMWCAEDAVILVNNGSIFIVGPDDRLLKMDIVRSFSSNPNSTPNLYCVPEVDGVRIFHDDAVEFLQKVNDDLYQATFPISLDSAKKLLEAYKVLYIIKNSSLKKKDQIVMKRLGKLDKTYLRQSIN